jgi:hypothetical protein
MKTSMTIFSPMCKSLLQLESKSNIPLSYADEPAPAPKPAPVPVKAEEYVAPQQEQSSAQDISQNNGLSNGYDTNNAGNSGFGDSGAQSGNYGYQQQNDNGYGNDDQEEQDDSYGQTGIKEDG